MDKALELLTAGLQAVMLAAIPILVKYVVDWLKAKAEDVKKNMDSDLLWKLEQAASIVVKAAEQMKIAGLIEDKKDYALGALKKLLESRGIHLDVALLEAAIEAAVNSEFSKEPVKKGFGVVDAVSGISNSEDVESAAARLTPVHHRWPA